MAKTIKKDKYYCNKTTYVYLIIIILILVKYTIENHGKFGFYENYLWDFKIGFVSRGVLGSIANHLYGIPLPIAGAANIAFFASFITDIFLFLFFSMIIAKTPIIHQWKIFSFSFLILVIPSLYNFYLTTDYGWLDIFWFLSFFLCALCLKNKYLIWLLPMICFMGMAFHQAFSILVLPSIILLQYYEMQKNYFLGKHIAAFVLNFVSSLCGTIYFFLFQSYTVKFSKAEFLSYVLNKYSYRPEYNIEKYWEYGYNGILKPESPLHGIKVERSVLLQFGPSMENILVIVKSTALLLLFVLTIWIIGIIKSKTKSQRLFFVGLLMLPIFTCLLFFVTPDFGRWTYAYLTTQFLIFVYLLHDTETEFSKTFLLNKKLLYGCFIYLLAALALALRFGAPTS